MNKLKSICFLAGTVVLTSCGGGGSSTGGLTEFSVIPDAVEWSALKGDTTCKNVVGDETLVTVVGGTPPYTLVNSASQFLAISDTTLTEKNPTFKVVTRGGCTSDVSILVLDNKNRSVTFKVTVKAGEENTTTTTTP